MPVGQIAFLLVLMVAGTFLGGLVPLVRSWSRESLSVLLSFGSGVLLGVIFLQMIPVAVESMGAWGGAAILGGFIATSLLESGLHAHRHSGGHDEEEGEGAALRLAGTAVTVGLGLHAVLDGLVLGTGLTLAELGAPVFLAILIHKGPDAFALSTVLRLGGRPVKRILVVQGLFSLATPVAAVVALLLLRSVPASVVGVALGGASGTLLAVASEDLHPEVHRRGGLSVAASAAALRGGVGLGAVYVFLV